MKIYCTLILLLLSGSNLFSQVYTTQNGKAKFEASMPFNTYTGESDQLQGKINFETRAVEFSLPVKSIKYNKAQSNAHNRGIKDGVSDRPSSGT